MQTKLPELREFTFAPVVIELFRRQAGCVFEHPSEVLWVFKAHFFGHLTDGLATENEILGTHDDEVAYVVLRILAKCISDDVAKVAR